MARWFVPYYLAESRVFARLEQAKSLDAQRSAEQQRRIALLERTVAELEDLARRTAKLLEQDGQRLDALERRPSGLSYGGVWSSERGYPANSLVTDRGAWHIAVEPTIQGERPGGGGPWRTISKSDETMIKKLIRDALRKSPTAA